MPVTIHAAPARDLTPAEIDRWRAVPVAVAVDLSRDVGQIDPAIRPLLPAGRQPRLFGRAVTAFCEPPDFGAVLHALDLVEPGDVLVIAAAGHAETAMIGEILGGHLRRRGGRGVVCDGAVRDVGTLAGWPDFSVFARWITPRGPSSAERGAVNLPVVIGGRLVTPGDLVIGDDDWLVALSPSMVRAPSPTPKRRWPARPAGRRASPAAARRARRSGCRRPSGRGRSGSDLELLGYTITRHLVETSAPVATHRSFSQRIALECLPSTLLRAWRIKQCRSPQRKCSSLIAGIVPT